MKKKMAVGLVVLFLSGCTRCQIVGAIGGAWLAHNYCDAPDAPTPFSGVPNIL